MRYFPIILIIAFIIFGVLVAKTMTKRETIIDRHIFTPPAVPAKVIYNFNQTVEDFDECKSLFLKYKNEIIKVANITDNITKIKFRKSNLTSVICVAILYGENKTRTVLRCTVEF